MTPPLHGLPPSAGAGSRTGGSMSPAEDCSRGVRFTRGHPPTRHPSPQRSLRPLPVAKAKLWTSLRRLAATFAFALLWPDGNEERVSTLPASRALHGKQDMSDSHVKLGNKGRSLAARPAEQRYLLPAASKLRGFFFSSSLLL